MHSTSIRCVCKIGVDWESDMDGRYVEMECRKVLHMRTLKLKGITRTQVNQIAL